VNPAANTRLALLVDPALLAGSTRSGGFGRGCASGWSDLGWLAAVLAIATAHVRAFGGSLGYGQDLTGPMAKQHRMFTLTVGTLAAAFAAWQTILAATLGAIVLGCAGIYLRYPLRRLEAARPQEKGLWNAACDRGGDAGHPHSWFCAPTRSSNTRKPTSAVGPTENQRNVCCDRRYSGISRRGAMALKTNVIRPVGEPSHARIFVARRRMEPLEKMELGR
jgi:hypothetical protein